MDATTANDLLKPLGVVSPRPPSVALDVMARTVAAASVALVLAVGCALVSMGDPTGGWPRVRVEIAPRMPTSPVAPAKEQSEREPSRQGSAEADNAAGVQVLRPGAGGTISPLIVRVPDEPGPRPVTDGRLLERTRHGPLPRIAPDGTKPVDVYARAPGVLPGGARPVGRVAIVVGGLGISQSATADAIARLPPAVTLAFAPYGRDLAMFAERARSSGREVMLQIPMEPFDFPDSDPGPHTLLASAKPADNIDHMQWAMGRFTGYVGLMNYMGAKVTADERALAPILREAAGRGLGFMDDGSSSRSLVGRTSGEGRVGRAELVLDALPRADAIDKALARLEALASSGRLVVATASALPVTLDRIQRWAERLESRGVLLVPASAVLEAVGAGEGARR